MGIRHSKNKNKTMACCKAGPGYASPQDAYTKGPREKLLYIPAVVPPGDGTERPDYLVTVDVDPESSEFGKIIHRLHFPYVGDELHHSGWNACSSCFNDASKQRNILVLPALGSGRVYGVDTGTDPRAPRLKHVVQSEEILSKTGLAFLHTTHCLGDGNIVVSAMGDAEGSAKGGFVVLNQDFKVTGTFTEETTEFGYDFWYQPRHNVLVSSSWGAPSAFFKGFNPAEIAEKYGSTLYFWDWTTKKLKQKVDLGADGLVPLEVRFLHDPASAHGYVGAALASNVIHFTKGAEGSPEEGKWVTAVAIRQPWLKVEGWALPELPPLITDILISLDDRFIYFSNWLRGDIAQYDISDPAHPKLAGRVWVGGSIRAGGSVKVLEGLPEDTPEQPVIPTVQGHELRGGPQMIQLSLDGKRLYVTNSLFSPWDKQFYPDLAEKGSYLLQIDVDTDKGGLKINPEFYVDFGAEPGGPVLAHEVRYPGGDCSSDIWL